MKAKIHPKYYDEAIVTCACGNSFTTGSALAELNVELCFKCHPFFTGKHKFVDTVGRIDKFKKRQEIAKTSDYQKKKEAKLAKKVKKDEGPRTLREMLTELQ